VLVWLTPPSLVLIAAGAVVAHAAVAGAVVAHAAVADAVFARRELPKHNARRVDCLRHVFCTTCFVSRVLCHVFCVTCLEE
jgi:hypothetical protein